MTSSFGFNKKFKKKSKKLKKPLDKWFQMYYIISVTNESEKYTL